MTEAMGRPLVNVWITPGTALAGIKVESTNGRKTSGHEQVAVFLTDFVPNLGTIVSYASVSANTLSTLVIVSYLRILVSE